MSAFSLLPAPAVLSIDLHCWQNAPLPISLKREFKASVLYLAPLNFPRKITRPVRYYALFKGWLLLSQPPGCLNNRTSFATEIILGTLVGGLGSFPRVYGTSLSQTDSLDSHMGIQSLLGVGTVISRPSPNSALPPMLVTRGYT